MDFWQSFAMLGRRWVFFAITLLMAVAITGGVFYTVKAQYQATSELLLVPPAIASTASAGNFVTDYGNLNTVASIVSYREDSQQVATQLKAIGIRNYTVSTDPTGAVPELIVTVTASSPPVALSENAILTRDVVSYLSQMQSGASRSTRISTRSLEAAAQATRDDKSRIRVVVAVGVVCVFLAVALTSLYDSVRRRRTTPRGHERATNAPRPGQTTVELDVPLLADGRVSNRAAAQYGRRVGSDLGPRGVGVPGAGSASAHFHQDS
jgi:hypothetical protein